MREHMSLDLRLGRFYNTAFLARPSHTALRTSSAEGESASQLGGSVRDVLRQRREALVAAVDHALEAGARERARAGALAASRGPRPRLLRRPCAHGSSQTVRTATNNFAGSSLGKFVTQRVQAKRSHASSASNATAEREGSAERPNVPDHCANRSLLKESDYRVHA